MEVQAEPLSMTYSNMDFPPIEQNSLQQVPPEVVVSREQYEKEKEKRNKSVLSNERQLLWSLLNSPELVDRNKGVIKDVMFEVFPHGLIYQSMKDAVEKGASYFDSHDLAVRTKNFDNGIDPSKVQYEIEFILRTDKNPDFFKNAGRFYDRWKKRECNRLLTEGMQISDPLKDDRKFDILAQVMELRNSPNPFKGNCTAMKDAMAETVAFLQEIWDGKAVFPKVSTGYPDLDALFHGGFDLGSVVVLGAASGHGKTASVVNMANEMTKSGTKVVLISFEMPKQDITLRFITSRTGIPRDHITERKLVTDAQKRKVAEVLTDFTGSDSSLLQVYCGKRTPKEVMDMIKLHNDRDGTVVFIIDYLQRVDIETENRTFEVGRFILQLGEIARERNLVIIGTSQLKREGKQAFLKRKPASYDLSESSYLENEASYIITLFRQDPELIPGIEQADHYKPENDGLVEFICCKQRNGRTGSAFLDFDGPSLRMQSLARSTTNPEYSNQFLVEEQPMNQGFNA